MQQLKFSLISLKIEQHLARCLLLALDSALVSFQHSVDVDDFVERKLVILFHELFFCHVELDSLDCKNQDIWRFKDPIFVYDYLIEDLGLSLWRLYIVVAIN